MPEAPLSVEVMRQLDRILVSPLFRNAQRLATFLRFTVESTLAGEAHTLKEWAIGVRVFERPETYSPQEDPIVRIMAGRVRAKLAEYYQAAGASDPLLIELPRGAYVPRWSKRPAGSAPPPERSQALGRASEAAALDAAFASACRGSGSMVAVSGDAGMGKTKFVESFLAAAAPVSFIASGRCSERLSEADAFAPVLEAWDGLCRGPFAEVCTALLQSTAPAWHRLIAPSEQEDRTISRERMRREFGAYFEKLCETQPVVLFLDDVHWADASTCDLIARLAAPIRELRLLIVVTYRPGDTLTAGHPLLPLRLQFQKRNACKEITLPFLTRGELAHFLDTRLPGHRLPAEFATILHERTEGNPLFLNDLIAFLCDTGAVSLRDGCWTLTQTPEFLRGVIPAGTHAMIGTTLGQLSELDRGILRCGAVQGMEFDSAVAAQVLGLDPAIVEERLRDLAAIHRLVDPVGEWDRPGAPLSVRYRFLHVFYQNALYASLTPSRRAGDSLAVAGVLASIGAGSARPLAGELAVLYETGRDYANAVKSFLEASRNAARLFAYPEAVLLAERGLSALATLPDSPDRDRQELFFSLTLGMALMSTRGYAAPEVERAHRRSRDLCLKLNEPRLLVQVLWGIHTCETNGGRLPESLETALEMRRTAEALGNRDAIISSLHALGTTLAFIGRLREAREAMEQIPVLDPPGQHEFRSAIYVLAPLVTSLSMLARLLVLMGDGEAARARATESVALAKRLSHPQSLAYATFWEGWVLHFQGWHAESIAHFDSAMELGHSQGLAMIVEWVRICRGSALSHLGRGTEALAEIRKSIERQRAMGSMLEHAFCLTTLADALLRNGEAAEALEHCEQALAFGQATGGRNYEPETLRLRGEALLALFGESRRADVEADFLAALRLARDAGCRLLELRAAASYFRSRRALCDGVVARVELQQAIDAFRPIHAPLVEQARLLLMG